MGTKSFRMLDQLPRWLLVILAALGIYLMHQKFDRIEKTLESNAKDLIDLKIVTSKLTTIIENRTH